MSWVAFGLLAVSGGASLLFETAWTRLFLDLFGYQVYATSAVLAAFMGGLGLGALIGGRLAERVRRPLAVYGCLEIAVAGWVALSPALVGFVDAVAGRLGGTGPVGLAVAWSLGFVLLAVPTVLMGTAVPLVCRALIAEARQIGRVFGLAYGANTLGAVAGVMTAGYWSVQHLGVRGTLWVGCGADVLVGLGALTLSALAGSPPAREAPSTPDVVVGQRERRLGPLPMAILVGFSGFTALAYEVVWIRLFGFVLGSGVMSLTVVLATLLTALGLGAVLLPVVVRRRARHTLAFGVSQAILGFGAILGLSLFPRLGELQDLLGVGPVGGLGERSLLVAGVLLIPGLAMGAALPAASGSIRRVHRAELWIGRLYASNTAGNVVGAVVAGFVLVPVLGAARSLVALSVVNICVAAVVLGSIGASRRSVRVALVGACALAAAGCVWVGWTRDLHRVFAVPTPHGQLVDVLEGVRGTVTVHEVPPLPLLAANRDRWSLFSVAAGYRLLAVDGVTVAGTSPDLRTTQTVQAAVPLLLHGSPGEVLQVGFGSGGTTATALAFEPESVSVVEINPRVIEQAERWFPGWRPTGYRKHFADAKSFVRRSRDSYDVILNDSTYPGLRGSSQLYSLDHFRACRARLADGGVVSTWLPVDLPPETFRLVVSTFHAAFPHCSYWLPSNCWNKHGVLVGSLGPLQARRERVRQGEWPKEVARALRAIGLGDPSVLASSCILTTEEIDALSRGAPVSSDDRPLLEFPSRGYRTSGEEFWHETLEMIVAVADRAHPHAGERASRLAACARDLMRGQLRLMADDPDGALRRYGSAARRCPGHPGAEKLTEDVRVFRAQSRLDDAMAAERRGDRELAIARVGESARLCTFSAVARYHLGRLLFDVGRTEASVPHLTAAIELGHGLDRARLLLGDAHALAGRSADAERCYRAYLATHPPAFEILVALADAVAEQGRVGEAVELLREARKLRPRSEAVTRRLRALPTEER